MARVPPPHGAAVEFDAVDFVRDGRTILDRIGWRIGDGERWVVLGPNGAGKSTLLRLASTYAIRTRGHARILGRAVGGTDLRDRRRSIAYVSTSLGRSVAPASSALEAVVTGADATLRRWHQEYTPRQWQRAQRSWS